MQGTRHSCAGVFATLVAGLASLGLVGGASAQTSSPPDQQSVIRDPQSVSDELAAWLGKEDLCPPAVLTGEEQTRVAELEERIQELREQARYGEAVPLAEEVLEIRQRVQGTDHWQSADAKRLVELLRFVAGLSPQDQAEFAEADRGDRQVVELDAQGRYEEAIAVTRRQLAILRELLGEEHPYVATGLNNLASLLDSSGEYSEAEPLHREALAMRRKLLGEEHPDVAQSLSNLAGSLRDQGDYAAAEKLYRQALALRRKLLGAEHPDVAGSLGSLGWLLYEKGDYDGAESLYRESLAMRRKLLGDEHPDVAAVLNNLAVLLHVKGKYAESEAMHRAALAMDRKFLGEGHPELASGLHNFAALLETKGEYGQAEELYREALGIWRKALGDEHPQVANSLNSIAGLLVTKGDYAGAEPLHRRCLAIWRKVYGEEHPHVAASLNNLAWLYYQRGDYAAAESLFRESLGIFRRLLGDEHPYIPRCLASLGSALQAQGDYAQAEPLFRESLTLFRQHLGDEHADVVLAQNNLAALLAKQGEFAAAAPLFREVVGTWRKLLGDEHPHVAVAQASLAGVLYDQGDYVAAEALGREALETLRKLYGEEHPDVARSLNDLALVLRDRGDYAAAEATWRAAADSFEAARLRVSVGGLDRVQFAAKRSPLPALAACLTRNRKPLAAWQRLEANLGRGLLDALFARYARPLSAEERQQEATLIAQLGRLDEQITTLLGAKDATDEAHAKAAQLRQERDTLRADFDRFEAELAAKYGVAAGELYGLARIQAQLPVDAALLAWVDVKGKPRAVDPNGEHWACVVRHQGEPVWARLPGSGESGAWTEHDDALTQRLREALCQRSSGESAEWQELVRRLYGQRIAPVEPHLQGGGGVTAVKHLIVLPAGWMAGVPVEALTLDPTREGQVDKYTVSYAPSGTMYAWLRERSRAVAESRADEEVGGLLALGDPVFAQLESLAKPAPEPPEHGVLIAMVAPDSNADRSGLKAGDVLLTYGGQKLDGLDDLGPAIQQAAGTGTARGEQGIPVGIWREGQTLELAVAPGKMGVRPSQQPAGEAIRAKRRMDAALSATRGESYAPLRGARHEVDTIAELFRRQKGEARRTVLLGSDASEQKLDELATADELRNFRFLHVATHGVMDDRVAMRSALVLSQDRLPDSFERVLAGQAVYDGRLTADQIVRDWKLDADLVTLSACQTALGKASGGEGYLGFAQALFVAGARSLVLSLWKVDDTATALLMQRFYENLLGQYGESRGSYGRGYPMPKAEALREAKHWLRNLTADQVGELAAQLPGGDVRGTVRERPGAGVSVSERHPYAAPYYWAAFILIGNPD